MLSPLQSTEPRNVALQSTTAVSVEHSTTCHQPPSLSENAATVRRPRKRRPVGVKTTFKHIQQPSMSTLAKLPICRPRRLKLCCGRCRKEWSCNVLHWIAILMEPSNSYPLIPTNFSYHVVCLRCIPHQGRDELDVDQVLTNEERTRLTAWEKYVYVAGTRTDYDVKVAANHQRMISHSQRHELVVKNRLFEIQEHRN